MAHEDVPGCMCGIGEVVEEAARKYMSEHNSVLTGFTLIANYLDHEGDRSYTIAMADKQSNIETAGQVAALKIHADAPFAMDAMGDH